MPHVYFSLITYSVSTAKVMVHLFADLSTRKEKGRLVSNELERMWEQAVFGII
jgi:hypothetical protein